MPVINRPTGGWPEGTTYWGYGTKYALLASELLLAINGNDGGLSDTVGFVRSRHKVACEDAVEIHACCGAYRPAYGAIQHHEIGRAHV